MEKKLQNLKELIGISEEFMVSAVTSAVFKELLLLSKCLALDINRSCFNKWRSCDVASLCELADKLVCKGAIDSCSKYFVSRTYYKGDIRDSINKADISLKTKNKIRGLKIEELTKKIHSSYEYNGNSAQYRTITKWTDFNNAMIDLQLISKDFTDK